MALRCGRRQPPVCRSPSEAGFGRAKNGGFPFLDTSRQPVGHVLFFISPFLVWDLSSMSGFPPFKGHPIHRRPLLDHLVGWSGTTRVRCDEGNDRILEKVSTNGNTRSYHLYIDCEGLDRGSPISARAQDSRGEVEIQIFYHSLERSIPQRQLLAIWGGCVDKEGDGGENKHLVDPDATIMYKHL